MALRLTFGKISLDIGMISSILHDGIYKFDFQLMYRVNHKEWYCRDDKTEFSSYILFLISDGFSTFYILFKTSKWFSTTVNWFISLTNQLEGFMYKG